MLRTRIDHLRARAGDQFRHQFGGQLVRIGHRDIARIGHDGLAGRVDEVQRMALVGLLELLPVQEHPVGQSVDPPAVGSLDQLDRAGVGQLRPRRSRTRRYRTTNPRMSARMVTETRSAPRVSTKTTWSISSALPASSQALDADSVRNCRAARCRFAGSAVALRNSRSSRSGSMPGVGFGRLCGAGRSTVPIACGADELGTPAQPTEAPAASATQTRTATAGASHALPGMLALPGWALAAAFLRSAAMGFIGSGLVVTLWPRTSGSVSRKQAPLPGSPHASSRPWCSRASSMLMARPRPVRRSAAPATGPTARTG